MRGANLARQSSRAPARALKGWRPSWMGLSGSLRRLPAYVPACDLWMPCRDGSMGSATSRRRKGCLGGREREGRGRYCSLRGRAWLRGMSDHGIAGASPGIFRRAPAAGPPTPVPAQLDWTGIQQAVQAEGSVAEQRLRRFGLRGNQEEGAEQEEGGQSRQRAQLGWGGALFCDGQAAPQLSLLVVQRGVAWRGFKGCDWPESGWERGSSPGATGGRGMPCPALPRPGSCPSIRHASRHTA